MDNKEKKVYTFKQRLAFSALVCGFLCFTVLMFGPLMLYVTAASDLWFGIKAIILPLIITFVVGFVVSTLIISLPKKTVHTVLCLLLFGIALGLYVQGNYANISYGPNGLDGSAIVWGDFTRYGFIDTGIWLICLAIPFALWIFLKKYYRTIIMIVCACILIVQAFTLTTTLIQHTEVFTKTELTVSTDGIYDLSDKENTLVFVLDMTDQQYLDSCYKKYPDIRENLEGFTEFKDTIAAGARTTIATPIMFTGDVFKKDKTYSEFIEQNWKKENLPYNKLKDMGVDVRYYDESIQFADTTVGQIQNIVQEENEVEDINSSLGVTKKLYQYTGFAYAPHYLKRFFTLATSDFQEYKSDKNYKINDAKFFENYDNNDGFTYNSAYDKAVRLYWLHGSHNSWHLNIEGKKVKEETSIEEQTGGCLNYIIKMLNDVKEQGLYDKTNVIITSDHGGEHYAEHSIFLVKRAKDTEGYTVSDSPASGADFLPTLASFYLDDYKDYATGTSVFDLKEGEKRVRYFYLNAGNSNDSRVTEYTATGTADDFDKFEITNKYYINGGKVPEYELGTKLSFLMDETANVYCTYGFKHSNGNRTPVLGPKGVMEIPIKEIPEGTDHLYVEMPFQSETIDCDVAVVANGKGVLKRSFTKDTLNEGLYFNVPVSVIGDDNKLELKFYVPSISDDEYDLPQSQRTKSLAFTKFTMYAK